MKPWIIAAALCCSEIALSVEITQSVSFPHWNQITQSLRVPIVIQGAESQAISIGTGEDGAFLSTAGTTTLDSAVVHQFTTFELGAGATLTASGNDPLRILVQGDVLIEGTIDLRGTDGGDAFSPASTSRTGGAGIASGGAGGTGISSLLSSTLGIGAGPSAAILGGLAGVLSLLAGTDGGAGGGGGNAFVGEDGTANAVASGAGGAAFGEATLATLLGGAGGGGGAGNTVTDSAGGGGGGGGGAFALTTGGDLTLSATGQILVTGGDGGAAAGGLKAGGGGGGAGGAVRLYALGAGTNDGVINAQGGSGGAAAVSGGDGSDGVNRFAFGTGAFVGAGTENPPPTSNPTVFYSTLENISVSDIEDTNSDRPRYTRFNTTETLHTGDGISYEIAGSSDGFQSDDTGYFPVGQISRIDGKRYYRVKVRMTSASAATTPEVTQVRVHFEPGFALGVMGCARAPRPYSMGFPWWFAFVALVISLSAGRFTARHHLPTRESEPR